MADDLYNLELLSTVSKITQEILNHTGTHMSIPHMHIARTDICPVGVNDKTLAEFVIALHEESKTLPEFKQKLKDVGAEFPESFVENVDRLILNLHPKHIWKS